MYVVLDIGLFVYITPLRVNDNVCYLADSVAFCFLVFCIVEDEKILNTAK